MKRAIVNIVTINLNGIRNSSIPRVVRKVAPMLAVLNVDTYSSLCLKDLWDFASLPSSSRIQLNLGAIIFFHLTHDQSFSS